MRFEKGTAPISSTPTMSEAFVRLGALAGAPPESIRSRLSTAAHPERETFEAALEACRPMLAPLAEPLGGSLLGRFLRDKRFDGDGAPARQLPKPARAALKGGEVVATSDADVWIMTPTKSGTQVSHAHPESFEVLGETIPEWLYAEVAAVERTRRGRGSASPKGKPKAGAPLAGKAAVDAALTALAELSGNADASDGLGSLAHPTSITKWKYFVAAVSACGGAWSPEVLRALEGRLLGRCLTGRLHDGDEPVEVEEDDEELDGINPVYVRRYPREARGPLQLVKPSNFVASAGPELWFILWDAKGAVSKWNISVHHAAPDGYEVLGETLEQWLASEVEHVRRALAR